MSRAGENVFEPSVPVAPTLRSFAVTGLIYGGLLAIFWTIARFFRLRALDDYPLSTLLSFALLFAPYWFFGFGIGDLLRNLLSKRLWRILCSALLALPYFALEAPRDNFQWTMGTTLVVIPVLTCVVLDIWPKPANWADWSVLAAFGLFIDFGLLNSAWPFRETSAVWPAGLGGFPKMMMANVVLYGYLVVKPIGGIGYDLRPKLRDFRIGLREFLFYAPIVLSLGFLLGFLHWEGLFTKPVQFPAAWIFTFFFVALPEELFFRGLLQNLLERHFGRVRALWTASFVFGLSHFNKGALFHWRYVLLAAIAGLFYGRAWRQERRLMASSVTHSTVDAVWSIWFR